MAYESEFVGTGIKQEVPGSINKIPGYDRRSGNHYWIMIMSYHIANPDKLFQPGEIHFDTENLVSTAGPGCYYCEQPYTPQLKMRRCPGHP
jgi:hypothetical protein